MRLVDEGFRWLRQYRAVARDRGDGVADYGEPTLSREQAEAELAWMLQTDPPYDEGFIEWRLVSDWGRLD